MNKKKLTKAYTEESDKLLSYIRKLIGRRIDIYDERDILQETFLSLLNGVSTTKSVDNITAYIYRSIRNRIIDLYRKPQIKTSGEMAPDDLAIDEFVSEALEQKQTMETIWKALETLPPNQKEIFIQTELKEKTFREISEETGISINTLLSRKRYAIARLREIISET